MTTAARGRVADALFFLFRLWLGAVLTLEAVAVGALVAGEESGGDDGRVGRVRCSGGGAGQRRRRAAGGPTRQ